MTNDQLQVIAQDAANKTWRVLRKKYPALTRKSVEVKLNNRLRTTAGRAFIESGYIDLCTKLLRDNVEEFVTQTIPHELAHQAAWDLFQCDNHAKPWKGIMLSLGLEPNVYHHMVTK